MLQITQEQYFSFKKAKKNMERYPTIKMDPVKDSVSP